MAWCGLEERRLPGRHFDRLSGGFWPGAACRWAVIPDSRPMAGSEPDPTGRDQRLSGIQDQFLCFATVSRAWCSGFQFGAYLSASSYLASASFVLPCFTTTSPQAFSGSAQWGPFWLASLNLAAAPS